MQHYILHKSCSSDFSNLYQFHLTYITHIFVYFISCATAIIEQLRFSSDSAALLQRPMSLCHLLEQGLVTEFGEVSKTHVGWKFRPLHNDADHCAPDNIQRFRNGSIPLPSYILTTDQSSLDFLAWLLVRYSFFSVFGF